MEEVAFCLGLESREKRKRHEFEGSKQTSVAGGQALGLEVNGGKPEAGKALQT